MNHENQSTIAEVEFGSDLGGDLSPLHQICPREGQTLRISLLDQFCKPRAANYHWHCGGFYACNTPKAGPEAPCCRVQRSWTCVCLAVQYLSADAEGKLTKGADIKYRVGYVTLRNMGDLSRACPIPSCLGTI